MLLALTLSGCSASDTTKSADAGQSRVSQADNKEPLNITSRNSNPPSSIRETPLDTTGNRPAAGTAPNSILALVNKQNPLPSSYVPTDLVDVGTQQLRAEPAAALEELMADAADAGFPLMTRSGYRSYETQQEAYNKWVGELGQVEADVQSARPGHSEHQLGLAMDLLPANGDCQEFSCFDETPHAQWLADHADEYGFIIRYQDGEEAITGFTYEPWHVRYVGDQMAADYVASGANTLEEFFGLDPAPDYTAPQR
jgi:D-alanyl-D-alanine carboxypeptidase